MAWQSFWTVGLLSTLLIFGVKSHETDDNSFISTKNTAEGTKWAVLVAGSNDYGNYRHQADVCHAYQILKRGGLKEENIIVFMYDDIAYNPENPYPGVIYNRPNGENVYKDVVKDYTGSEVNANNFYAVILGNQSALTGGSGKVLNSGPNDTIFIFYSDHGAPGQIEMPVGEPVYAHHFNEVLKKMHAAKIYRKMVIYLEACEAGSMFDGLLPDNMNIYAVTASNTTQSSWAAYCPDEHTDAEDLGACLGDLFSISWMEDRETHDTHKESLEEQYIVVKNRTGRGELDGKTPWSNVMRYGCMSLAKDRLFEYTGSTTSNITTTKNTRPTQSRLVNQSDIVLFHLRRKVEKAPKGSREQIEAQEKLMKEISVRKQIDENVVKITNSVFGNKDSSYVLNFVRPEGQPLVDDWDCFKTLVNAFKKECGSASKYERKYTRVFANMCNMGADAEKVILSTKQVCSN